MGMKGNIKSRQDGITLIALVITIIVMLILVGIAIASLSGDNGILKMAVKAKQLTEESAQYEQDQIKLMEAIMTEQTGAVEVPADAVARIDSTYYTTLQGAIDAVPTDNTRTLVALLKSVNENVIVAEGKNVALYLNGYTVSPDTSVTDEVATITVEGTLMVADGKIVSNAYCAIDNYATVQIAQGAEIVGEAAQWGTVYNLGSMNITGGKIDGGNSVAIDNSSYEGDVGKLTISGGEIISSTSNYFAISNTGELSITGGSVISENSIAIANRAGTLSISESAYVTTNTTDKSISAISNNSVLNITGGTVTTKYSSAIFNNTDGELYVKGNANLTSNYRAISNSGNILVSENANISLIVNAETGKYNSNTQFSAIYNNGGLYIEGGTVSAKVESDATVTNAYALYNAGTLEVSSGTIDASVNNSTKVTTFYAIYNTSATAPTVSTDSVTINGTTNL